MTRLPMLWLVRPLEKEFSKQNAVISASVKKML
jgi:hypothetical protein